MKLSAREVVQLFQTRGIPPDSTFVAAAGREHGRVSTWELPNGNHVVCSVNNAEGHYDITDNIDDLPQFLEDLSRAGDPTHDLLVTANVRGASALTPATPDDRGPFYVIAAHRLGDNEESSYVEIPDGQGNPLAFETYTEARTWISNADQSVYYAGSNESGRPTYVIVTV